MPLGAAPSQSAAPAAAEPPDEDPLATASTPDFVESKKQLSAAQNAYENKDWAAFLSSSIAAARAAPDSPRAIYNLACAQALSGQAKGAARTLERLAEKRVYFDVAADSDFTKIRQNEEFQAAKAKLDALNAQVGAAAVAFSIPEKDLIPEGIARDAMSGAFFVSSVHKRKIVRVTAGKATDFVKEGEHGLYAVMGLAMDEARRSLFAVSTALPEMNGYRQEDKGKACLVELDSKKGKLKRKVLLFEPGKESSLNDLVVDSKGEVIATDPVGGRLYSLSPGASALSVLLDSGKLASPQGIALSTDEKVLYVADYPRGIARVDRATKEVHYLSAPKDGTLAGIDGLVRIHADLIGIQNGVRPHRVVRLSLTQDGTGVKSASILAMNLPEHNEPTLGLVAGEELFYVGNSQWGSFDKGGVIWPMDKLKEPVILRLELSP